ncbi:2,3-bisphosphoglycerate-independent phosphoglycerate mutase [Metamycoplasma equirhinis]|uniref:2,3-bisphosphoglycerate-independent phosphoglycerate mutase n=2 Tax=Metamycoplasma equirhinis TaxID=92402 RepID=A0ABZ0PAQ0_9BACT|nr:2,3-bisphosphoglycerate-independent phosphoglycerate mutase [Metamycoplasma equirhinis]TPD98861.1 2,3-bisphosphoglycerate-independent phosphoglycerate mutase [Metamycoplasma equirhinis]WPB54028.1 2,3-bisphosphoglycerate-independent phosphoglycerate mutase [Metamycoplasma equirhinis]
MSLKNKKVILTIIDGLGLRKEKQGNAYAQAFHPIFDYLFAMCPNSVLQASGEFVGLPSGQIGNSEVGHLNIGAGRIVYTGLSLINQAIKENKFKDNTVLNKIIDETIKSNKTLHLMGLLSDGGVHSLDNHLFEIMKLAHKKQLKKVSIHVFGDGRDVKPQSIKNSLCELKKLSAKFGYPISSISGRFYAMDRDQIFERNELALRAILGESDNQFKNIDEYINEQYQKQIYDEFFVPAQAKNGIFLKEDDNVIFFNFRPDRARQLSHLLVKSNLYNYKPIHEIRINLFASLMKYEGINSLVAFEEMKVPSPLGEVIANNNLKQLRLAETQKYAHVTFFMDGGKDILYPNENRILVNSIKAQSFADCPQMSAKEITDELLNNIENYDFIIMNYANPDMVGHTGNLKATIKAIEFLDEQFERILNYVNENKDQVTWFITADHGNAEITEDQNNQPATKHTTSPVMFITTDKSIELKSGSLCDVAPSILDYLNIAKPKEMGGTSLIKKFK